MLLWRSCLPLACQHIQSTADQLTGLMGKDDLVNVPKSCRHIRISKLLTILLHQFRSFLLLVLCRLNLLSENDVDCAIRTHDSDFGSGPGVDEVRSDMPQGHDVECAAVALSRDDGDKRNRRLCKGVEDLRSVADDTSPLLRSSWEVAGHVPEGDDWYVEGIAESYGASTLVRGIDVERACKMGGVVSDYSH